MFVTFRGYFDPSSLIALDHLWLTPNNSQRERAAFLLSIALFLSFFDDANRHRVGEIIATLPSLIEGNGAQFGMILFKIDVKRFQEKYEYKQAPPSSCKRLHATLNRFQSSSEDVGNASRTSCRRGFESVARNHVHFLKKKQNRGPAYRQWTRTSIRLASLVWQSRCPRLCCPPDRGPTLSFAPHRTEEQR